MTRPAPQSNARLNPAASVLQSVAADSQRSRLPQMAAALSYRTIFGLIPVIVVALVGLRAFTTEKDIKSLLQRVLDFSGLKEIVVDGGRGDPSPPLVMLPSPEEQAVRAQDAWFSPSLGGGLRGGAIGRIASVEAEDSVKVSTAPGGGEGTPTEPESAGAARLDDWIENLVSRVVRPVEFTIVGLAGIATLLYAAISMLVEIERAFNQIYRVPRGRSWVRRITQYWTLLTLGAIGLFTTFYVGEQAKNWVGDIVASQGFGSFQARAVAGAGFLVTVMISTGLLVLAYTTVPNTKVKIRSAFAGAFIAAILWETGKWGFTQYIRYSTGYARLYGSIALIPLFLLWVYVTWVIVLLGLQISYMLQFGRFRRVPTADDGRGAMVVDPACGVAVMTAIARRFDEGKVAPLPVLAKCANVAEAVASLIIERFLAHGLVHRISEGADTEGYALARPPQSIDMPEVLAATYEVIDRVGAPEPGPDRADAEDGVALVERLRQVQLDALAGITVADLLAERRGELPVAAAIVRATGMKSVPAGSTPANGARPAEPFRSAAAWPAGPASPPVSRTPGHPEPVPPPAPAQQPRRESPPGGV